MRVFGALVAFAVAGCGFAPATSLPNDAVDAPPMPITCGDLTCDPHAVCNPGPSCSCRTGFTGNGFTCADVDECATDNGGCPALCANKPGSFTCYAPRTCSELPGGGSGDVTLYIGADATKPWPAFCANGKEYLTLPAGAAANYSQYTKSPTSVRTSYTRIRLDPITMLVDISDETYSTSTGSLVHGTTLVTSMPYGVAMDCAGNNQNTGVANIDLTGTPFAVSDPFALGGSHPDGTTMKSSSNRVVALTGGGNCGWNAPAPAPYNPFNTTGGPLLDIVYQP